MDYRSQGQGGEGAVSIRSCPVRAILENYWRRAGPTSELGACGLESDYCQEKSKGKDGQDQMLLESTEGEAIEMRLLLQTAGRDVRLVHLCPE